MKFQIGTDESSRSPVIGSLTMAIVVVDRSFWRKFSNLRIIDSKLLNRTQRDIIVAKTNKHLEHFHLYFIKPYHMENNNLNDLEAEGVVNLLNTYKEFWNNDIYIDLVDPSRELFIDRMNKFFPNKLKEKVIKKLNFDKWKLEHFADKNYKVVSLASIYAKAASDNEYDEIRKVWGDFGSGTPGDPKTIKFLIEHPDCPHIRRSFITWKRLQEYPELKTILLDKINNNTFKANELKELYKKYEVSNNGKEKEKINIELNTGN